MMNLHITWMSDHVIATYSVNNLRLVCQTKKKLCNLELCDMFCVKYGYAQNPYTTIMQTWSPAKK